MESLSLLLQIRTTYLPNLCGISEIVRVGFCDFFSSSHHPRHRLLPHCKISNPLPLIDPSHDRMSQVLDADDHMRLELTPGNSADFSVRRSPLFHCCPHGCSRMNQSSVRSQDFFRVGRTRKRGGYSLSTHPSRAGSRIFYKRRPENRNQPYKAAEITFLLTICHHYGCPRLLSIHGVPPNIPKPGAALTVAPNL